LAKAPGHVILPGGFMAVQQAIGCGKDQPEAEAFLRAFVEDAKASGLVASLIARHKVQGLSIAPAA
jgi:polar amino acid transport system substrate-binding protein